MTGLMRNQSETGGRLHEEALNLFIIVPLAPRRAPGTQLKLNKYLADT